MSTCERCYTESERLYEFSEVSEYDGDLVTKNICWNCDHNVSNGASLFDDAADVLLDRAEKNYEFDPINCERPY